MELVFDVATPVGFRVRCATAQWLLISTITLPPIMGGRLQDVIATVEHPDEVRRSVRDADVPLLSHRRDDPRWVCAVATRTEAEGFLIAAYAADRIEQGAIVWTK
jgi:hypothetical protein